MSKLLSGYRVIESSMLLNGASTGMMLVDLGADVIKVESPFLGDYLRIDETMFMHLQTNKGKRSLALDLRKPEGRDVLYRLLQTADVFLTNAVADRNNKLGIGYEQLKQIKPDIIYCQNTGFGATGPYAEMPSHGQMMDALAGATPMEMGEDGLTRPSSKFSRRTGTLMSGGEGTAAGAVYAAMHIAAALAHRARTGEGCYIDVAAASAVIASAWVAASAMLNSPGSVAHWQSEAGLRNMARYQWYETRDRKFVIFCPEEKKFWARFCDVVDRDDLRDKISGEDFRREIQTIMHTRDQAEWIQIACEHQIPIGPAYSEIEEVQNDPQMASRQLFVEGQDAKGQPFTYIGQPAIVSEQPYELTNLAPELGEHTIEILRELNYADDQIAAFAANGITSSTEFRSDHITTNLHGNH